MSGAAAAAAPVPVAVWISGRGSNLGALLAAAADPAYPARIALVLSDRADAGGLDLARAAGVPALALPSRAFGPDRAAHEAALEAAMAGRGLTPATALVALAGYMRVLTPGLVERWRDRMVNIHPSLLPAFPGTDTHARALAAGVRLHGCTVHLVRAEVDAGPILAQAAVPVLAGDDAAALAARVLAREHLLYPAALALLAAGRVRVGADGVARLGGGAGPGPAAALSSLG